MKLRTLRLALLALLALALATASTACDEHSHDEDDHAHDSNSGSHDHEHEVEVTGDCAGDLSGGDAAAGATVFADVCADCHGPDGDGLDTGVAATSGSDLYEHVPSLSDGELCALVQGGIGAMPAQSQVDLAQIKNLLPHLRASFGADPAEHEHDDHTHE
jgi:ABC-type Zn2+ transport system substrate-binding protein/surface adhesin